jgi:pSer/pThr/pTyr-binding forkhead associated (FHA) protein
LPRPELYHPPMLPSLVAMSGPLSGATLPLTDFETSIGREAENRVRIADHSVSARHCVITCGEGLVTIRDLDPSNPTFVNALPSGAVALSHGDQIQIGESLFVLTLREDEAVQEAVLANVADRAAKAVSTRIMRREDVLADTHAAEETSAIRLSRDLSALVRITAAINNIRGLVSLKRPLLELIADVVPAARGTLVLTADRSGEIASAVGWRRGAGLVHEVEINRVVVDRVLHDGVGVLSDEAGDRDPASWGR